MGVLGVTDLVDFGTNAHGTSCVFAIDHNPESVSTAAPKGSLLIRANGGLYRKLSNGNNTDVTKIGIKNNLSATVAPGTGDDSDDNYEAGSMWVDIIGAEVYICVDASVDAAVWKQITN